MGIEGRGVQLPTPAIIEQTKQSKFICSACGSGRDCDCSAPALLRAAEAVKTNPGKSDRAIAKDIAVSQPTVSKARKEVEATDNQFSVEARTGLDGKTRKVPQRKPTPNIGDEATRQLNKLCEIVHSLMQQAETHDIGALPHEGAQQISRRAVRGRRRSFGTGATGQTTERRRGQADATA